MEAKRDLRDGAHHLKSTKLAFQFVTFFLRSCRGKVRGAKVRFELKSPKISWSKCHSRSSFILLSFRLFSWVWVCACVCLCVCMRSMRSFGFIDGFVALFFSPSPPMLSLPHSRWFVRIFWFWVRNVREDAGKYAHTRIQRKTHTQMFGVFSLIFLIINWNFKCEWDHVRVFACVCVFVRFSDVKHWTDSELKKWVTTRAMAEWIRECDFFAAISCIFFFYEQTRKKSEQDFNKQVNAVFWIRI